MGNKALTPTNDLTIEDAVQILHAIRTGCVDAFVVEEQQGHAVYALQNADLPYSSLVQRMQQGAAMLNARGEIIFCNPSLAALFGTTVESLIGRRLEELVGAETRPAFQTLLQAMLPGSSEVELQLHRLDHAVIPARFSFTTLASDRSVTGVLVTDLTTEKSNAELASRIQRVQDEERRGIARELHDSVGQLLAAITMNLDVARKDLSNPNFSLAPVLDDTAVMVAQVSKEIRTISHLLHPPLLDVAGLASAIRWYVDGFSERSRIKVELQLAADLGRLSNDVEIAVFRVVQECLTNVYRHSGSDACSVNVARHDNRLRIEIRDCGRGISKVGKGNVPPGVGLRGMQERLRQLGGSLEIDSSETGTVVIAVLPVSDTSSQSDKMVV